jgi:hypothetical protein
MLRFGRQAEAAGANIGSLTSVLAMQVNCCLGQVGVFAG